MKAPSAGHVARLMIAGLAGLHVSSGYAQPADAYFFNQGKLPAADKMIESMCGVGVKARLLVIESVEWLHHVVVFVYPADSEELWVWDPQHKSLQVKADPAEPMVVAKAWVASVIPGQTVNKAWYDTSRENQQCDSAALPVLPPLPVLPR